MKAKIIWLLLAGLMVHLPVKHSQGADSSSNRKSLKQFCVVNYPLQYFY